MDIPSLGVLSYLHMEGTRMTKQFIKNNESGRNEDTR